MEGRYIDSLTSPKLEGFEWQDPEGDKDRKGFRDILDQGCHIIHVVPDESDADLTHYCFSIGFYLNLLHPEILVMGLSGATAGNMINDVFAYVEGGKALEDGQFITYDVDGDTVRFAVCEVPRDRYLDYLGYANWFYRSLLFRVQPVMEHKYPVVQLVWPDRTGLYPWDENCDPNARSMQTLHAHEKNAEQGGAGRP